MSRNILEKLFSEQLTDITYKSAPVTRAQAILFEKMKKLYKEFPTHLQQSSSDDLQELLSDYPGSFTINQIDNMMAIDHRHVGIVLFFGQGFNDAGDFYITVAINDKIHYHPADLIVLTLNKELDIISIDDRSHTHPSIKQPKFELIFNPGSQNQEASFDSIKTLNDLGQAIVNYIAYELVV